MSIEAMKQALEALESYYGYMEPLLTVFGGPRVPAEQSTTSKVEKAITSIRQAIAEAEKQVSYTGNGTAGREDMTAPTGFLFQMPKAEKQEPACPHIDEPFGCYRVRCQLGRKCVDAQSQPETVMAEFKYQAYGAYRLDGEMQIGVIPEFVEEKVEAKFKEKNNG